MNIILMAGGGGTRLWPLSRQKQPKQFLDLGTGKTLLEQAYDRAVRLVGPDRIYVATLQEYFERTREVLPALPDQRILTEPAKRDTAPAFAAVAARLEIEGQGTEPAMFMWADHVFTNEEKLIEDLAKVPGLIAQHPQTVIIVGHRPTGPDVNFGYIEAPESIAGDQSIRKVISFKEKPDAETAEQYVKAGGYFWNMAYISLTPKYLLSELDRYEPELMTGIRKLQSAWQQHDDKKAEQIYKDFSKQAIDYALLEKTPRILAVTGDYGWSDVGNWAAVREIFGTQGDHMPHGHHLHVNSDGNYIYNTTENTVSLLGVENLIVVVTDDAILITSREHAPQVKDVVASLQDQGKTGVL